MLRIFTVSDNTGAVIRLEGKLRRAWVPEVRAALAAAPDPGRARLDLRGLTFVDRDGLEFLHEMAAGGVALVDASPFIAQLLADAHRRIR